MVRPPTLQASRPASVLYFACRIFNVVGTSNPTAFNELKKTQDLLQLLLSVRVKVQGCVRDVWAKREKIKISIHSVSSVWSRLRGVPVCVLS